MRDDGTFWTIIFIALTVSILVFVPTTIIRNNQKANVEKALEGCIQCTLKEGYDYYMYSCDGIEYEITRQQWVNLNVSECKYGLKGKKMPLVKSKGNMYSWTTHMHTHLGGQCHHKCLYCYVQRNRFGVNPKYQGDLRIISQELNVNYGADKIIFIEHMNDMFAKGVSRNWIMEILEHCCKYPNNQYIFQTKNPENALLYKHNFPKNFLIGTTIETDSEDVLLGKTQAPSPIDRYSAMLEWAYYFPKNTFVTIEPIMTFNVAILSGWIRGISPLFINIGADSKNSELDEPDKESIEELIKVIQELGIEIKKKSNLERLLK